MKVATNKNKKSGFSLVEMLVVIAVIGIIAAIAVPSSSKINRAARYAKDQRNAQQIASVVAAAQAAGYDFVAKPTVTTSKPAVVTRVVGGYTLLTADNPSLAGTYFGVPGMAAAEQTGAANFLTVTGGRVVYDANLVPPGTGIYQ